ncbi:MAG: hypothetical protein GYA63_05795 [Armatimonadetes bacterium]|nr:hypothetical protein [Armatimonadota bacterium]
MVREITRLTMLLGGLVMMNGAVDAAENAQIRLLGQPCHARNVAAGRAVVDPVSGREWFVLTNENDAYGVELIFIDFENYTGEVYSAKASAGAWSLNEVPGGRLVVGTYYDGTWHVFDLRKKAFVKSVKFPGEDYIWNCAIGKDGRLYGGSYPRGKLGALNLDTYEVEDCGTPTPHNMYLRNTASLPDGRIFCNFGMKEDVNYVYDPATKKFEKGPESFSRFKTAVQWNGYLLSGNQAFDGKTLAQVTPLPFPAPEGEPAWTVDTRLTTPDTLYLNQGNMLFRYQAGDVDLTLVTELSTRGGSIMAVSKKGWLLGIRGQDYFVIKPGDTKVNLKPIPGKSAPRPTLFLRLDGDNLWGGPGFGQTLFRMNKNTGEYVNYGRVSNHGGEVYDVVFIGKSLFGVSYAGGEVIRFDWQDKWDQFSGKNPRTIARMNGKYIRPIAGVNIGKDGMLYSGWSGLYGKYDGAVSITDPKTGKNTLIENPLAEQAVSGAVNDGKYLYVTSSREASGLGPKPDEECWFGILDPKTHKLIRKWPVPTAIVTASLTKDAKTGLVVFQGDDGPKQFVCVFDPKTPETAPVVQADWPAPTIRTLFAPGDGKVHYASGKKVYACDLKTKTAETVAEMPADVNCVTVDKDGTLYVSCGVDVYQVKRARK